jgi:ABC-2 type transport system permease protein
MPEFMRNISVISPLNWGMEAFYGVFLRGSAFSALAIHILKFVVFFIACVGASFYYQTNYRMR